MTQCETVRLDMSLLSAGRGQELHRRQRQYGGLEEEENEEPACRGPASGEVGLDFDGIGGGRLFRVDSSSSASSSTISTSYSSSPASCLAWTNSSISSSHSSTVTTALPSSALPIFPSPPSSPQASPPPEPPRLETLPDEILVQIFSSMARVGDVFALRGACRRFKDVVEENERGIARGVVPWGLVRGSEVGGLLGVLVLRRVLLAWGKKRADTAGVYVPVQIGEAGQIGGRGGDEEERGGEGEGEGQNGYDPKHHDADNNLQFQYHNYDYDLNYVPGQLNELLQAYDTAIFRPDLVPVSNLAFEDLKVALWVDELADAVDKLAKMFVRDCFEEFENSCVVGGIKKRASLRETGEVKQREMARVREALWRFEQFCVLFGRDGDGCGRGLGLGLGLGKEEEEVEEVEERLRVSVLRRMRPWEMDALGAVHDWICRGVSDVLDEVVASPMYPSLENFKNTVPRMIHPRCPYSKYIQAVISRGLVSILSIFEATTLEEKKKTLALVDGEPLKEDGRFLHFSLWYVTQLVRRDVFAGWHGGWNLFWPPRPGGIGREEGVRSWGAWDEVGGTGDGDGMVEEDKGPETIWRWAHSEDTAAGGDGYAYGHLGEDVPDLRCLRTWYGYSRDKWPLRRWGYTVWDWERLDKLGIMEGAWRMPLLTERQFLDGEIVMTAREGEGEGEGMKMMMGGQRCVWAMD